MPRYLLNMAVIDDDGGSYDVAWHVGEEVYTSALQEFGPPHGEWMFTAEENKNRLATEGGIGVIHDVP